MRISWPREFIFLIVPTIVAIVVGPFGTYEHLSLGERTIYWFFAMTGVGAIMSIGMQISLSHPGLLGINYWLLLPLVAGFCALPGAVVIVALEAVFRDILPTMQFVFQIFFFVFLIGTVISGFKYPPKWRYSELTRVTADAQLKPTGAESCLATDAEARNENDTIRASRPMVAEAQASTSLVYDAVLLRRLRPEIGRDLIKVSVRDHYVEVTTRNGQQTLLMRMADVERELDGYPGLRVHRSHWVALPAVRNLTRNGNKWTAHLVDDVDVPVSRSRAGALSTALGASPPHADGRGRQ